MGPGVDEPGGLEVAGVVENIVGVSAQLRQEAGLRVETSYPPRLCLEHRCRQLTEPLPAAVDVPERHEEVEVTDLPVASEGTR